MTDTAPGAAEPTEGAPVEPGTAAETPAPASEAAKPAEGEKAAETAETEKPAAEPEKPAGPPETYDLKPAEGLAVYVDEGDLAQVADIARKNGWTNEEAQGFLNMHLNEVHATSQRWLEATKADKDYGGENLAGNLQKVRQVIDRIRPEGHPHREPFMRFFERAGAGNHLEVVAFLADLGKLMGEDMPPAGRGSAGGKKNPEDVLYK